jgi:hypothetical protein
MKDLDYFYYEVKDLDGNVKSVKKIKVDSITKCVQGNFSSGELFFINKYIMAYGKDLDKSKELEVSAVSADEETGTPTQQIPSEVAKVEFYPVLKDGKPIGKRKVKDIALAENVHAAIVNGEALISLKAFTAMDLSALPEIE